MEAIDVSEYQPPRSPSKKDDLANTNDWSVLTNDWPGSGGRLEVEDVQGATQRVYRLQVRPQ